MIADRDISAVETARTVFGMAAIRRAGRATLRRREWRTQCYSHSQLEVTMKCSGT